MSTSSGDSPGPVAQKVRRLAVEDEGQRDDDAAKLFDPEAKSVSRTRLRSGEKSTVKLVYIHEQSSPHSHLNLPCYCSVNVLAARR